MDTIVNNTLKVPLIISQELDLLDKEIKEKKQENQEAESLETSRDLLKRSCLRAFNKELANLKSGDKILWVIKNTNLTSEESVFMVKTISQIKFKEKNHPKNYLNEKDWVEKQFGFLVAFEDDFKSNFVRSYFSFLKTDFLNAHFVPILPSTVECKLTSSSPFSTKEEQQQLRNWEEDAKVTIQILEECFPNNTIMLLNENVNL